MKKPKIVCICGSTRFADVHFVKKWEFEKNGEAICLTINVLPDWYLDELGIVPHDDAHLCEQIGNREIMDELHLRKIDIADEVFVVNVGGYIGESTRKEIEYAKKQGKPVYYLEEQK